MMMRHTSTANAVWIATALLHKQNPQRSWFTSKEIEAKVVDENLLEVSLQTLRTHISQHCVANKPANPDTHRKLSDVGRGRRKLYAPSERAHPSRANGRIEPSKQEIPSRYHYLIDWFNEEYMIDASRTVSIERKSEEEDRFAEILNRLLKLTPEERKERAKEAIKAVIAFERRRQK